MTLREAKPRKPTARHCEILSLVARGMTTTQVARELHYAPGTVKTYVAAAVQNLNANNRTHAVVIALCHGWIRIEPQD